MNIGLYQSASTLSALERWQEAVAQNITSAQTNGYRKRTVQFSTEYAGHWNLNPAGNGTFGDQLQSVFTHTTKGIDFTGGETEPTHRDLDVAVQGDGFFEVKAPNGGLAFTRNGEFQLRADRTLVTSNNAQVMTDAGTPVVTLPEGGTLTINPDGTIFQGTTSLGRLAIEKFQDNNALTPAADGMFTAGEAAGMSPVAKPDLLQGYLEESNVQPLREMVDMVLISRAYEANQKVITSVDQQMDKALTALG